MVSPTQSSFLNSVPIPMKCVSDDIDIFPVPFFAKSYGLSTAMHLSFFATHPTIGVLIALPATKKLIDFLQ